MIIKKTRKACSMFIFLDVFPLFAHQNNRVVKQNTIQHVNPTGSLALISTDWESHRRHRRERSHIKLFVFFEFLANLKGDGDRFVIFMKYWVMAISWEVFFLPPILDVETLHRALNEAGKVPPR
jgi:hypothetical protein